MTREQRSVEQSTNAKSPPPRRGALAVFGTASDVGKSIVATALCRHLSDRGYDVAPFKAQNMSNNSGVTADGREMGRAQIVQAHAARVEPHVDMNPVLLKPASDRKSQVVLLGLPYAERDAHTYFDRAAELRDAAFCALERLGRRHETLVLEGAGSCAEANLRSHDFVNFETAHAADASVILVADIDRGGVFAQVVGTLDILEPEDRARVRGVIINRFRGDPALFESGVEWLEARTGLPVFGVLPYLPDLGIDAEDAVVLDRSRGPNARRRADDPTAWIAVVRLPHISNFTDFDPLERHPGATLHYLTEPTHLCDYDLVILPGSKAVVADLEWLRARRWQAALDDHVRRGGRVAGICGGYQMLGREICDPSGIEGAVGSARGLGLLDVSTTFTPQKRLTRVRGSFRPTGEPIRGYEIHMGRTDVGRSEPLLELWPEDGDPAGTAPHPDGAQAQDGRIFGTYLHGLFDAPDFVDRFLGDLRAAPRGDLPKPEPVVRPAARRTRRTADGSSPQAERAYDALAAHFREHIDVSALEALLLPPT